MKMILSSAASAAVPLNQQQQHQHQQQPPKQHEESSADVHRIKLEPEQASKVPFPPGCPVVVLEKSSSSRILFSGEVNAVYISFAHNTGACDNCYEVIFTDPSVVSSHQGHGSCNGSSGKSSIVARGEQLRYGINCPINISPPSGTNSFNENEVIEGVIKGFELQPDSADMAMGGENRNNNMNRNGSSSSSSPSSCSSTAAAFLYTVEVSAAVNDTQEGLYRQRGIGPEYIRYRPVCNNNKISYLQDEKTSIVSFDETGSSTSYGKDESHGNGHMYGHGHGNAYGNGQNGQNGRSFSFNDGTNKPQLNKALLAAVDESCATPRFTSPMNSICTPSHGHHQQQQLFQGVPPNEQPEPTISNNNNNNNTTSTSDATSSSSNISTSSSSMEKTYPKCSPLTSPIPNHFQGDIQTCKNEKVPEFTFLVNFPLGSSRNNNSTSNGQPLPPGRRVCVMCGELRWTSPSNRNKGQQNSSSSNSKDSSKAFIPNQNKGLCTCCDVNIWVVNKTKMQIKWCKGCKNFQTWAAFGEKGSATKCMRCRDRQREKYAMSKRADKANNSNSINCTGGSAGMKRKAALYMEEPKKRAST